MSSADFTDSLVTFYNKKHESFVQRLRDEIDQHVQASASTDSIASGVVPPAVFSIFERFLKQNVFLLSRFELEPVVQKYLALAISGVNSKGGNEKSHASCEAQELPTQTDIDRLVKETEYLANELKTWEGKFYRLEQTKMEEFYSYLRTGSLYIPDYVEKEIKCGMSGRDDSRGRQKMGRDVAIQVGKRSRIDRLISNERNTNGSILGSPHDDQTANDFEGTNADSGGDESVSTTSEAENNQEEEDNTLEVVKVVDYAEYCSGNFHEGKSLAEEKTEPKSAEESVLNELSKHEKYQMLNNTTSMQGRKIAPGEAACNDAHEHLEFLNTKFEGFVKDNLEIQGEEGREAANKSVVEENDEIGRELKEQYADEESDIREYDAASQGQTELEDEREGENLPIQQYHEFPVKLASENASLSEAFEPLPQEYVKQESVGNERCSQAQETEILQVFDCAEEVVLELEVKSVQCSEKVETREFAVEAGNEEKPKQQQRISLLKSKGQIDQAFTLPKDQGTMTENSIFQLQHVYVQTESELSNTAVLTGGKRADKAIMTNQNEQEKLEEEQRKLQSSILRKREQMKELDNEVENSYKSLETRDKVLNEEKGSPSRKMTKLKGYETPVEEVNHQLVIEATPSIKKEPLRRDEEQCLQNPMQKERKSDVSGKTPASNQKVQDSNAFFRMRDARMTSDPAEIQAVVRDAFTGEQVPIKKDLKDNYNDKGKIYRRASPERFINQSYEDLHVEGLSKWGETQVEAERMGPELIYYRLQADEGFESCKALSEENSNAEYPEYVDKSENSSSVTTSEADQSLHIADDVLQDVYALRKLRDRPTPQLSLGTKETDEISKKLSKPHHRRRWVHQLREKADDYEIELGNDHYMNSDNMWGCDEFSQLFHEFNYVPVKIELDASQIARALHYKMGKLELLDGGAIPAHLVFDNM